MGTKKFDEELYKKADPLSNGIMEEWLKKHDYECIDLTETYGVDITCKKNNIISYFETEIAYIWKDKWPNAWLTVHIPYRKKKIIDKWVRGGSCGTLTFVQFRKDCKQAWFLDGQSVRDAPVKTINTKYTTNEKFYCIDVNDEYIINMEMYNVPKELISRKDIS